MDTKKEAVALRQPLFLSFKFVVFSFQQMVKNLKPLLQTTNSVLQTINKKGLRT
ncbi:hypothetical protein [Megasphaera sp.]|jgi:hypothetical protein|uniref:hypothetical protein n=1 Tax=Megasphaera sp. TaxID=2023260 RepID=UPI003A5C4CBB